ncbi:ABC transporter ATP-binding protein [Ancylobacter pratisalsi]|uniref:ABC transporter ATP-binding protein n=1 Tax=Ancylobacter pratisalsi TaxID=1745854 RepID=A0A6P1YQD6_9HYPH|nr:ABC transporter ATP-binding protein [Ancylobacter pratisalsi]QIB33944.1 ABC transporter ATP-binding protein [Ancylobacter pratisalsi]
MKVLHGISLEVLQGEVVCIIGPNGAGKSTFLRTLSGLNRPTDGSIVFKGEDVTGARPHQMVRRGLGHCPEGRRVFQQLSIEENLIAGYASGRGKSFAELRDQVFELFPILGERRGQSASRLSGGQQQMLAIGRALMGSPDLLLLDEPSLGLAPIIIHQIFEIVLRLAESGVSIILVEQNIDLSFEVADYVYAFEHGALQCSGPAAKMKADERIKSIFLPDLDGHSAH